MHTLLQLKHRARLFAVVAVVVLIGAFGQPALAADSLKVVVTIKPIHSLVAQVMGTTGTPTLLVKGNASAHTYSLKPSDARALGSADVLFRVSDRLEPFTLKAVKILTPAATVISLIDTNGMNPLPMRRGGAFENHSHKSEHHHHDKTAASAGKTDHAKADHTDDDDDASGAIDGHVWLDTDNAKLLLDRIAAELSARAPQNAAIYKVNTAAAKAAIDALASELATDLKGLETKPYLVFHDAYQYFERKFGLTVAGTVTIDPDRPVSGKRLSELRAKITSLGATCVFGEPNFDAKVIRTLTANTKAKSGTLDPEGASIAEGPLLYDTLLRNLAKNIKACLASTG